MKPARTLTIAPKQETEVKQVLKQLYWDYQVTAEDLFLVYSGRLAKVGHIDAGHIYHRLLTSLDWYGILSIVPGSKLPELLDDAVLDRIRFKDLRERYRYARQRLLH